jgi:hypothetical protein
MKITHWAFGGIERDVDTVHNAVHYVNNPYTKKRPYWAKRITIEV